MTRHCEDFDKIRSKVTQHSLEVNLFKPHGSVPVVVVSKFGDHSTLFVQETAFLKILIKWGQRSHTGH